MAISDGGPPTIMLAWAHVACRSQRMTPPPEPSDTLQW